MKLTKALSMLAGWLVFVPGILYASGNITPTNPTFSFSRKDSTFTINTINSDYVLHVKKRTGPIKLDGVLNEEDWKRAQKATDFYMVLPYDTGYSAAKSEVMMTYGDKAFYLAIVFYDTIPGKRPVESLRRDFVFGNNDNFLLFLDTYNDQTTGYSFGANAAGAKWDGTMSDGHNVNLIWDCKWQSKTKNYKDRWVTEMRIPFKSIRYQSGVDHWNVQFSRLDLKMNEKSAWAPVPRQFPTASLAYAGVLKWETPPPKSGLQFSLIPYIFGSASRDFEAGTYTRYRKDFGMDAKLGLSSSLNLDLTYNPDFSQAEVDDQVTILDRFELYYPEKRQFFLENSDLFANYGSDQIRPFFSRRIGLDAPVLAGARLSGKIGNDWRIGVMDMQTEKHGDLLARNFFVASVQKKVFSRSNIGAIFVNKQNMNVPSGFTGNEYNRVAGLEYNLASSDNYWTGEFFGLRSFTPGLNSGKQFSQGAQLSYSRKQYELSMIEYYVGKNFNAETGYVPRVDYLRLNPRATVRFYPENNGVEYHGFFTELDTYFRPGDMDLTDREVSFDYFFQFHNRSHLELETNFWYIKLRNEFDPTNQGDHFLSAGTDYNWFDATLIYQSDNRKTFKYELSSGYGGFYNGNRWHAEGLLNYRFQPFGYISMVFSYNNLMLPQPWGNVDYWLVGPKLDVTFTDKIFFTTYVQYNEQIDNINVNARLQWRYQPVSDIYLVYTDNYFPGNMEARNRALVFKMTYWFN
ncbi:carbohydrate binding family 9 domain-containing protein [Prolixibacter sp. NT017]|uniref:carbohydrate binding family 9 domain-containing protein n=1 Tax=Prolixibacter sp. NT017 TaxID=2652390 RepID=UPI00127D222B|nr:carbohydrate binding family 9 domain-containing protein [Prolixibacter sp. NT017]GET27161.1 hypothetical protein NT017_34900 [Prolixibacter sp. NT017]